MIHQCQWYSKYTQDWLAERDTKYRKGASCVGCLNFFSDRPYTIYVEVYQTWFLFCYVVRHTFYENLSKNDTYSHWKPHSTFNILNSYLYLPPKSKVNKEKNLNRYSCAGEKWHRWQSQKKEEKIMGKQEQEKFSFTFSVS